MKTIAQNQIFMPIFIQKQSFMGKTAPVKPFVLPKSGLQALNNEPIKAFNPAYFHPSFCASLKSIKAFDNFMDSIIQDPQKITEETEKELLSLFRAAAKASKKNYINRGSIGKVYRISDKYVFKMNADSKGISTKYAHCKIKTQNFSKDLSVYYGEELATIGNTSILKNAVGNKKATVIGTPINKFIFDFSERIYYRKHKFARKIAAMPQEAFDKVALNFNALNKEKNHQRDCFYGFDYYNPNNFLIVGDEIRITDAIDDVIEANHNSVAGMLNAFVNQVSAFVNAKPSAKLEPARKEILKKCFLASEKVELPLRWNSFDKGAITRALELSGVKHDTKSLNSDLQNLREAYPESNERLEKIKDYLNSLS